MKKKLLTICILSVTLCNLTLNSANTSTKGKGDDASTIPPIIIRPPVNKQNLMNNSMLFIHKSTFVDRSFEL